MLSRRLAREGVTSVRVDLPGIGDTAPLPHVPERQPYAPWAPGTVASIAAAVDRGDGVVLAGLCSGARNALDAVTAGIPAVRGLILLNAPLATGRPELEAIVGSDPEPASLRRAHAYHRVRHGLVSHVPPGVWRVLDRSGLRPSAIRGLRAATASTDVLVVSGHEDFGLVLLRRTAAAALEDLVGDHLTVVEVDTADHALFEPAGRRDVVAAMIGWILERRAASGYPATQ